MVGKMDGDAVEAVGDGGAGRAAGRVVGPEHEVIDKELRPPPKKVRQRGVAFVGLESILLPYRNPRKFLATARDLVAAIRQFLLLLEQVEPGGKPLFTRSGLVCGHTSSSPFAVTFRFSIKFR
jgi:hypothetical protein